MHSVSLDCERRMVSSVLITVTASLKFMHKVPLTVYLLLSLHHLCSTSYKIGLHDLIPEPSLCRLIAPHLHHSVCKAVWKESLIIFLVNVPCYACLYLCVCTPTYIILGTVSV